MPLSEDEFSDFKVRVRNAVDERLAVYLDKQPAPVVVDVARHILLAGGHRWRGMVAMAAGSIFAEDAERMCLPGAVAVEMCHAASMLLDDLPSMDDAVLRRGRPCAHTVFPRWAVDLAPAYLVNLATQVSLRDSPVPHELRVRAALISAAAGLRMAQGQQDDLTLLADPLDISVILTCYERKSGALYAAAAQSGAVLAGASDADAKRLERAGLRLGLSYQIMDDIADMEACTKDLGKHPGMDEDKFTAPRYLGVERARALATEYQNEALKELEPFGDRANAFRAVTQRATWAPV